ncbi:hypothetical protein GW17_00041521 [Ensete ventricosum]|nr:hypothetical protein GW17_00041521 [Ensete ventricosum]
MSFGSKPSVSCADARWPVRPSYRWPESDAKFVKSMAGRGERGNHRDRRKKWTFGELDKNSLQKLSSTSKSQLKVKPPTLIACVCVIRLPYDWKKLRGPTPGPAF